MIKMINLVHAVQLPGNAGATRCINRNTMPNIHIERCDQGFELHFGKLDGKDWRPTGQVKTVTWTNVYDWDEERPVTKEQKK